MMIDFVFRFVKVIHENQEGKGKTWKIERIDLLNSGSNQQNQDAKFDSRSLTGIQAPIVPRSTQRNILQRRRQYRILPFPLSTRDLWPSTARIHSIRNVIKGRINESLRNTNILINSTIFFPRQKAKQGCSDMRSKGIYLMYARTYFY